MSEIHTPPPHSRRVQAWVYAILNPVIDGLKRELFLLEKGNLSWRFYSRKCEYIRPVSEYIESSQLPNYEDFLADELNSRFKSSFEAHDHAVSEIELSATRFFDGLMQSGMFRRQVKDSLEKYESSARSKPQYPALDSMREDLPKYVAEYLINHADFLPQHYTMHQFWEDYKNSFEHSADEFEPYQQRASFQALKQATVSLKNTSKKLFGDLKDHRYLLCSKYDIPAAPTLVDKSHKTDAFIV